jgi:hypothetical protein
MAVRLKSSGSSVGPFLGGLAALITAVAGLVVAVHQYDDKKKEDQKPNVVAPANIEPKTNPVVNEGKIEPAPRKPAVNVNVVKDALPEVLPQFNIEGTWHGVAEHSNTNFEVYLHKETEGVLIGTVWESSCYGSGPHSGKEVSVTSVAWDGKQLVIKLQYPAPPSGFSDSRIASLSFAATNNILHGTFSRNYAEEVTLSRGAMKWCGGN